MQKILDLVQHELGTLRPLCDKEHSYRLDGSNVAYMAAVEGHGDGEGCTPRV